MCLAVFFCSYSSCELSMIFSDFLAFRIKCEVMVHVSKTTPSFYYLIQNLWMKPRKLIIITFFTCIFGIIFIVLFIGVYFFAVFPWFFRYQLGLHDKPIGVLNVANYWGSLIEWVCEKESFLNQVDVYTCIFQD